jgi:predicted nuclease of predicted toxin-antitoxin system
LPKAREISPDPGDAALLRLAAEEARILVTIDTDFATLVYLAGAAHAGIIRLPDVPPPARIALMEQILTRHGEADLASAVVTVKGSRVRFTRASPRS